MEGNEIDKKGSIEEEVDRYNIEVVDNRDIRIVLLVYCSNVDI